jgi:hypothetical protein
MLMGVTCVCCAFDNLQKRFPELYAQLEGDIDKVASRVAWEYLEGMNWVLCYYACGPAALDWRQQQQQEQGAASAGAVGASWSYSYSHHYAPLMQVGGEAGTRVRSRCLVACGWVHLWCVSVPLCMMLCCAALWCALLCAVQ